MPYKERIQQLTYMKEYMKTKRMGQRLERLKQKYQDLRQKYETDSTFKLLIDNYGDQGRFEYMTKQIAELEDLLKGKQNCYGKGDIVNPSEIAQTSIL